MSRAPTAFSKTATGAWESVDRKYEVRREGLRVGERFTLHVNGRREVSFFAWPEQHAGLTDSSTHGFWAQRPRSVRFLLVSRRTQPSSTPFSKHTKRRAGFRQEAPASSLILISNLRCGTSGGRNRDDDRIGNAKLTSFALGLKPLKIRRLHEA